MPVLNRIYNRGSFRIKVLTNASYFIRLLDSCLGKTSTPAKTLDVFNVTLKISTRPFTFAKGKNNKNIIHFKDSIIDTSQKIIYSYYPNFPAAEQAGILLSPLWCLLIYLGYYPMHGALIKSGSNFIAFFGPSESGKSTLSSASSMHGFSLICDDCFFVKNTAKTIKILPLAKTVKVRNIHKKNLLDLNRLKISPIQAYFLAKRLVIIFPKYSIGEKMRLSSVSNKSGIIRLMGDNLTLETGQPDSKKGKMKMLDFICLLGKKTSFYELTYNDYNISGKELKILHKLKQ